MPSEGLLGIGLAAAAISAGGLCYYYKYIYPIRNSKGNTYEPVSENIQIAVDALGEDGGTVWLPPTTFYTSNDIVLRSNTWLYGFFGVTKIVFSDNKYIKGIDAENIGLYNLCFTGAGAIGFTNCINVEIKNVTAKYISYRAPAFAFFNCRNSIISECKSKHTEFYGIYIGRNSEYCTVDRCDISDSYYRSASGIQINQSNYNLISNNHVYRIGTIPTGEFDTTDGNGGPGIRCSGESGGAHNNIITRNHIHHIREHGIKVYSPSTNNEISHNKIYMVNMGNPGGPGGGQSAPYAWGLDLQSANIVKGNEVGVNKESYGGIVLYHDEAIGALCEDNHIYQMEGCKACCILTKVNCVIQNNYLQGFGTSIGIILRRNNATVENNTIDRFYRAIHTTAADYAIIRYNLLKNSEIGVYFDVGGNGLTVNYNTFNCVQNIFENEESLVNSILEPNEIIPC
jgi:hypothetical protein